jgi:hypothetical protein
MKDIRDIPEPQLRQLYAEYRASIGRPLPAVHHRQGRVIPNAVAPTSDSLSSNAGHCLVVYGEYKADELT